jgi:hypothetical protein
MAMRRVTKPMLRTAQGNPTLGWSCRNMTGKITAPTLDPIDAIPIAIGRFVVKLVEIIVKAGI